MSVDWEVKKLGEVCLIRPPKSEARKRLNGSDLVSFVPMEDLETNQKMLNLNKARPFEKVVQGYTYFADEDVLLAKITPCFENGKLGIARNLENGVGFGSSEYIVFRPNESLDNEFLYYFLSRDQFREEGTQRMRGAVGHKRVDKEFIENYEIPVPPIEEQRRIVAMLDEALAGVQQATANTERNLANTQELFDAHLQAIFANPADDWEEKTLGEVCENLDRKRVPITKRNRVAGDYPYYGASGIVDYVNDYIFDENLLLVSEDGANLLARTYPIAFSVSGKIWVNNHAHVLRFNDLASQYFIEFVTIQV